MGKQIKEDIIITEIRINEEEEAPLAYVDEETLDILLQYPEEEIKQNKFQIRFKNGERLLIDVENLLLSHLEHEILHAVLDKLLSWEDGSLLDNSINGQWLELERLKEAWVNVEW